MIMIDKLDQTNANTMDQEVEKIIEETKEHEFPRLKDWIPTDDEIYFYTDVSTSTVKARFEKLLGFEHPTFPNFTIKKPHFMKFIKFIIHHVNYYITFYDTDKEFFMSMLSVKWVFDNNTNMKPKAFKRLIKERIFTPVFIERLMVMTDDLYDLNIDTADGKKFSSTPKITNAQARGIVAISFGMKLILPLLMHFSNVSTKMVEKKDYIPCFNRIFMELIRLVEDKTGEEVYTTLCNFIKHRLLKKYYRDKPMWDKKEQLYGISSESYLQELINDIVIVKSLYKLEYWNSVVSYIDSVFFNSYRNFIKENFSSKPVELGADDANSDSDEYLSRAEALEMVSYNIDESNIMLNEVNNKKVMEKIERKYAIEISDEEFEFYKKNYVPNQLNQFLLHCFYTKYFKNPDATLLINIDQTIRLSIYMKAYLTLKGLYIFPQLCTAQIKGKYKENIIKNTKILEKLLQSPVYQDFVREKFKYLRELNPKEDTLIKRLSSIINTNVVVVDPDPEINGIEINDVCTDIIIEEYLQFLSII